MLFLATNTVTKHSLKGTPTVLLETHLMCYAFLEPLCQHFLSSKEIEFRARQAVLNYKSEVPSVRYSSLYNATRRRINWSDLQNETPENRGPCLKFLRYSVRYRLKYKQTVSIPKAASRTQTLPIFSNDSCGSWAGRVPSSNESWASLPCGTSPCRRGLFAIGTKVQIPLDIRNLLLNDCYWTSSYISKCGTSWFAKKGFRRRTLDRIMSLDPM